jgi:hypothetical protein
MDWISFVGADRGVSARALALRAGFARHSNLWLWSNE